MKPPTGKTTQRSSAPSYPNAEREGSHLIIRAEQWCPGPHPEPHLRHDQQTGYWESLWRCLRCEKEALQRADFPEDCYVPQFAPGQRVLDEQNPESPAIVLHPDVGRADRHIIDGFDGTVADFGTNADYPSDDRVVRVVFVDWLNAYAPGWRKWDSSRLPRALRNYSREFGVSVKSYDYPESRLSREPAGGGTQRDAVAATVAGGEHR